MHHTKPRRPRPLYLYEITVYCMGTTHITAIVRVDQATAASYATERYLQAERITTQRLCRIA